MGDKKLLRCILNLRYKQGRLIGLALLTEMIFALWFVLFCVLISHWYSYFEFEEVQN